MKKIIVALIVLLGSFAAKAQVTYHNYLDCSSEWRWLFKGWTSSDPYHIYITTYFDGDTTIGGFAYYRQKSLYRDSGSTIVTSGGYYFIREDSFGNFINSLNDTTYKFKALKQLNIGDSLLKTNEQLALSGFTYGDRGKVMRIGNFNFGGTTLHAIYPMDTSYTRNLGIYPCIVEGIGATFPHCNLILADYPHYYLYHYKRSGNLLSFNSNWYTYPLDSFPTPVRTYTCSLPINELKFNIKQQSNNNVLLSWLLANSNDVSFINIQRSFDGKKFSTIDKVTTDAINYTDKTIDATLSQIFYRLEVIHNNTSKTFSEIKTLNLKPQTSNITIYPNPATNQITINRSIGANTSNMEKVSIVNILGKTVQQLQLTNPQQTIDISSLTKGVYVLSFESGEKLKLVKE